MKYMSISALALLAASYATALAAPQATTFSYQGRLHSAGLPANGSFDLVFTLWDAPGSGSPPSGGTQIGGPVTKFGTLVSGGLFTVQLNESNEFADAAFDGNARWLQISVNGTPLAPRQPLTATPYALQTRGLFVDYAGNVGVGTTTPAGRLHVAGDLRATTRTALGNDAGFGLGGGPWPQFDRTLDFSHSISDFSSSQYWSPVLSTITLDPNTNLTGANTKEIYANSFEARVGSACNKDLDFVTGLEAGAIHRGSGHVYTNLGLLISSVVEGPGSMTWNEGIAVAAGCGWGATGQITNNYGITVGTGIWDTGVNVQNNTGILVQTPFTTHPITNHYGIYLENQNAAQSINYAIYSDGGDVHFNGDLDVTGVVSKGGGSFKIDHPLDPENKYLYHSFVESPDMLNIYNGNVTTDDRGYATVSLPAWFESLNRDFRYQLTVVDDSNSDAFVQAKIAGRIKGNSFTLRSSAPRTEISWQVTGIRKDAFANAHRIPVEQDKPADERGRFLHPELFGRAADRAIRHAPPSPPRDVAHRRGMPQTRQTAKAETSK